MALLMGAEQDKPVEDDMSEEKLLRALMEAQESHKGVTRPERQWGRAGMITVDDLIALVRAYNPNPTDALIRSAWDYGAKSA